MCKAWRQLLRIHLMRWSSLYCLQGVVLVVAMQPPRLNGEDRIPPHSRHYRRIRDLYFHLLAQRGPQRITMLPPLLRRLGVEALGVARQDQVG